MHSTRAFLLVLTVFTLFLGCDTNVQQEPEPEVVLPETFTSRVDVGESNKYFFPKVLPLDSGRILLAGYRSSWNERSTDDKRTVDILIELVDEELHNIPAMAVLGPLGNRESLNKISAAGVNSYGFEDIVAVEDGYIGLENERINSMVTLGFSIVKLNTAGSFVERHTINPYKHCDPKFMVQHASGDLIIAGTRSDFEGEVELEENSGMGVYMLHGVDDIQYWTFAMRITQEGEIVWEKLWDAEHLNALTQDAEGQIYLMTDQYDEWHKKNTSAVHKLNPDNGSPIWKHAVVTDRSEGAAMIVLPDSSLATLTCTWNEKEETEEPEWYDKEGFEVLEYTVMTTQGKKKVTTHFKEGFELEYPQLLATEDGVLAAAVDVNTNTIYLWKIAAEGEILWEKNFKNQKAVSIHALFNYGTGFIGMLLDYDSSNINETGTSILRVTINGDFEQAKS